MIKEFFEPPCWQTEFFKMQEIPKEETMPRYIKQVGINICPIDALIEEAKMIINASNKEVYCEENILILDGLEFASYYLDKKKIKNKKYRS